MSGKCATLLKAAGCKVPRDIGLAALSVLDGNADAGIDQNSEEIGKVAIQLLISLINHNECSIPKICREVLVEGKRQHAPRQTRQLINWFLGRARYGPLAPMSGSKPVFGLTVTGLLNLPLFNRQN